MFDRLSFVIGEAFQNLRRHGFMTFSAIAVVAISLTIIGGFAFLYTSAQDFARTVPGRFDMYVLLKDGTDQADITQTAKVIRGLPGVERVNWIPRDKAWERHKQLHPRDTEGIPDNPLPDAYKVVLNDLSKGDQVADAIRQLPVVDSEDGVRYMSDEQRIVQGWLQFIQWIGFLGIFLFLISGILIFNTIRLAAIARRTEVRIMRLVGASRATVAVPFMLEGIVEGALGGFLSAMIVWGGWRILSKQFNSINTVSELQGVMNPQSAAPNLVFPFLLVFGGLTVLGTVYGLICSLVALRLRPETR